jgi:hypothetical protein
MIWISGGVLFDRKFEQSYQAQSRLAAYREASLRKKVRTGDGDDFAGLQLSRLRTLLSQH